jgi:hypothetical protein
MKRKIGIPGLAAVLAALGAPPAAAQVRAVSLFAYGGGYSAAYNVYNLNTAAADGFKTGFNLGGGIGLEISKNLEIRATLSGAQSRLRQNGAETGVYLNRYYVGADLKGRYPLASGLTPYGLLGGGGVLLHAKGTTGQNKEQGYFHLGLGVAYPIWTRVAVFAQADGFFYSLSGLSGGALSPYSSAQRDIAWSAGASYRLPR